MLQMFTGREIEAGWDIMNAVDDADLPGEHLLVDTRFSGTRVDPGARGSIGNIGLDNFTPEHLVAGVRAGIVAELFAFYECLPQAVRASMRQLAGSGNGLRKNPALRRAFEARFHMPLRLPAHTEEASFGAALLAGIAGGLLSGMTTAGALIRYDTAEHRA